MHYLFTFTPTVGQDQRIDVIRLSKIFFSLIDTGDTRWPLASWLNKKGTYNDTDVYHTSFAQ